MEVCTAELVGIDVANRTLEVGFSGSGPALDQRLTINSHNESI